MGTLQNTFETALKDATSPSNIARNCFRDIAKRRGHVMSNEELARAEGALKEAEADSTERITITSDDGHRELIFSGKELHEALRKWTGDFSEKLDGIVEKSVVTTAEGVLQSLYESAPTALAEHHRFARGFERRLRSRWRDGLRRLRMLLLIAQESHQFAINDFEDPKRRRTVAARIQFDALLRLHSRACKTTSEILSLLETGHADGAMARWRTLHETAIVCLFLARRPMKVSSRFLGHAVIDQYKAALQYQKHVKALGYTPIDSSSLQRLQVEHDRLIKTYGEGFGKEYGWASEILGRKRTTFSDIEEAVRMEKWRPYYKMACNGIHSGAHGLQFSLGIPPKSNARFLLGVSNAGLCDPGHCAAISLTLTTTTLLTKWNNIDHLVTSRVMLQLTDEIGEAFFGIQKRMEKDTVDSS